jgi:HD superfamily phosphohydrolase YqeK
LGNKEIFKDLMAGITRTGINDLAVYLEEQSDFYTAPCSTKYHLSVPGGLVRHSLNVHKLLVLKDRTYKLNIDTETLFITSLFHDICKVNFYGTEFRNVKNDETGQWEKKQIYVVKDQFPMGHGEKSVIMLQQFIPLTEEEQLAIRWHMGPFTEGFDSFSLSQAYYAACKKTKLVPTLFAADYEASQIFETEGE